MNAATIDPELDPFRHRRRRHPAWVSWAIAGAVAAAIFAFFWLREPTITSHDREHKVVNIALPPPPPPPPPEVKPEEKPPEPKPQPIEQPRQETPPPPTPQDATPTQGTDALTAREGAGPSNYGLAVGNGSGSRIGGTPGGSNGFAAYAERARAEIYRATTSNSALQGRYRMPEVRVWVDAASGRITRVEVVSGSGDRRRDNALEQALQGLQLSQRPPAGMPYLRLEFARTGA